MRNVIDTLCREGVAFGISVTLWIGALCFVLGTAVIVWPHPKRPAG